MRCFLVRASFAIVLGSAHLPAQTRLTDHTVALDDGAEAMEASIDDVAWIEGAWRGSGLGGIVEEIWTAPAGGAMVGMFRLTVGDSVRFYEIMTLREEGGSVTLLIKHFNPNLTGWEEKDEAQTARLVWLVEGEALFEGVTFHQEGRDQLLVFAAMRQKDGSYRELRFEYTSAKR